MDSIPKKTHPPLKNSDAKKVGIEKDSGWREVLNLINWVLKLFSYKFKTQHTNLVIHLTKPPFPKPNRKSTKITYYIETEKITVLFYWVDPETIYRPMQCPQNRFLG